MTPPPQCWTCGQPIDLELPPDHPDAITRGTYTHGDTDQPHHRPTHRRCTRPDPLVLYPATRSW